MSSDLSHEQIVEARGALPRVGESESVWCMVRGSTLRALLAAANPEARADSAVPSSHVSGTDGPSVPSDRESGECVRAPDGEIERGWLIERKAGPFGMKNYPARWWKGGVEPLTGEDCWTADANNACRFCRAVDASAALIALSWRDGARTGCATSEAH